MDETAAVEGMQLNGKSISEKREGRSRYVKRDGRSRKRVLIVAEGFDVSVPKGCTPRKHVFHLESELRDHFSSCGKVKSVCIPHPYYSSTIKRFAYIEILGEGAKEKALKLSGIEMDGHKLVVTAPLKRTHIKALKSAKSHRSGRSKMIVVRGYDTSLPRKIIKSALSKKFSSCGEVLEVDLYPHKRNPDNTDDRFACVSIYGEGAKAKALQLNGCYMKGCKLAVENPFLLKPPEAPVKARDIPIGLPPRAVRLSDPNWREKYYSRSRSRLRNVEKKEEEDPNWRVEYLNRILLLNVEKNKEEDPNWREMFMSRIGLRNVEKKEEEEDDD